MDRNIAERIVKTILDMGPAFDALTSLSKQIADEEEARDLRRKLANIMHLTNFDVLMPIVRQFPELDPDR